ncbi:MAG: putative quinol monooxygenase [Chloroflexota bacterium]|nr:putative quinol monooxygenase [Chloroflexota bacterium]
MITIFAKLQAAEGKEDEFRSAIETMVAAVSENEPDVMKYALHEVDSSPGTFLLHEVYANDEALKAHGQTDHMKAFGQTLKGISGGRPEISRVTEITDVKR